MEPATILGALLGSYVNKVHNRCWDRTPESHTAARHYLHMAACYRKVLRRNYYSDETSCRFRSQRNFGSMHVQVLPPWLTTVLLAALLLLLSSKLVHRGVLTYRSETKAQRAAAADAQQSSALEAPLVNEGARPSAVAARNLCQLVTWTGQCSQIWATCSHVSARCRADALDGGGAGTLPAIGSASSLYAGGSGVRHRGFRRLVSNASVSEDTSFFESTSRTTVPMNAKGAGCF
jgi:hypothetical protein